MRTAGTYLSILFFFLFTVSAAHAQSWLWARSAGGTSIDNASAVATDVSGNVYVTGSFSSPTITFGATTLTNVGNADVYVVKYSASGSVIWAKSAGGTGDDYVDGIATDASGNVYITGNFGSASIAFGASTLTNSGSPAGGGANIFLVKYDASGDVLWANSAGDSTYYEAADGVATDASGNVYITGYFNGTNIAFGATTLTNAGAGSADLYLVKYSASGSVIWAKSAGGIYNDEAFGITTDRYGYVYISGYFGSPTITFGATTLTNAGSSDVFVAKYDTSGNVHWAKSSDGTLIDMANAVTTDASGNVYVAGGFASATIAFGAVSLTNAASGTYDIFIVKYDSTGGVAWAQSAGGIDNEEAVSLTTDDSGNVYATGYFGSPSITFGPATLTNAGTGASFDMFLVKYNTSGSVLWAQSVGGTGYEYGLSVTTDTASNLYVAGSFTSTTISFDTIILTNVGSSDMYVAKYGIAPPPVIASAIPAARSASQDIILFPNPASGKITLGISNNSYNSATIYDCLGSAIINVPLSGAENTTLIDVSNLSDGIYYLKAISGTGSENVPFVIRHQER